MLKIVLLSLFIASFVSAETECDKCLQILAPVKSTLLSGVYDEKKIGNLFNFCKATEKCSASCNGVAESYPVLTGCESITMTVTNQECMAKLVSTGRTECSVAFIKNVAIADQNRCDKAKTSLSCATSQISANCSPQDLTRYTEYAEKLLKRYGC